MPKNLEARRWGAELIREVVDKAREKGRTNTVMTRMAYVGAGQLETVSRIAAGLGYRLVIQPPEERDSGKWYAMGGNWRELLKTVVFHWWNREDAELIATGHENAVDNVTRDSQIRRDLRDAGLNASIFNDWMQCGKVPTMESFCLLCMFEGFGIEWREVEG